MTLAKELFSSFVVKRFEVHLIVSLGGDSITSIPNQQYNFHSFEKKIIHLFKEEHMNFNISIH